MFSYEFCEICKNAFLYSCFSLHITNYWLWWLVEKAVYSFHVAYNSSQEPFKKAINVKGLPQELLHFFKVKVSYLDFFELKACHLDFFKVIIFFQTFKRVSLLFRLFKIKVSCLDYFKVKLRTTVLHNLNLSKCCFAYSHTYSTTFCPG